MVEMTEHALINLPEIVPISGPATIVFGKITDIIDLDCSYETLKNIGRVVTFWPGYDVTEEWLLDE